MVGDVHLSPHLLFSSSFIACCLFQLFWENCIPLTCLCQKFTRWASWDIPFPFCSNLFCSGVQSFTAGLKCFFYVLYCALQHRSISSSTAVTAQLAKCRFPLLFTSWRSLLDSVVWTFCIFLYTLHFLHIWFDLPAVQLRFWTPTIHYTTDDSSHIFDGTEIMHEW